MAVGEHDVCLPVVTVSRPLNILCGIQTWLKGSRIIFLRARVCQHDHLGSTDNVRFLDDPMEKTSGNVSTQPELRLLQIPENALAQSPVVVTQRKARVRGDSPWISRSPDCPVQIRVPRAVGGSGWAPKN